MHPLGYNVKLIYYIATKFYFSIENNAFLGALDRFA